MKKPDKEGYINAMTMAKSWLERGIINESDYAKAEIRMMKKYRICEKSIFRMKLSKGGKNG